MTRPDLPPAMAEWREAPRVRALNDRQVASGARYVFCWLQQALRAVDNPVIDAAVRLGNALGLPVLVYHGVREDYPYASDRLHRFILGASVDLRAGCLRRGIECVQHVDRAGRREKGLVYRLAADAAAVIVEDQPTFIARWQSERVATRVGIPVFAVNAACLVPPAVIEGDVRGRFGFLRQHEPARADWSDWTDELPALAPFDGPLPFAPDQLEDVDLDALVASLDIDHTLPASASHPPGRDAALERLNRLVAEVLPTYAAVRNDATQPQGASGLSPYLHFGVVGPREVVAAVNRAAVGGEHRRKFLDELLGWREWFHFQAGKLTHPERYHRIAGWARATLEDHAVDPRPEAETLAALLRGETRDETWNACQRQFLANGWMHNNLRMYWGKRLIAMTPSSEAAWATACYLNDRLSLDGRDPATYGNIAAIFAGKPADRERPVYGLVPTRGDSSVRGRSGGAEWLRGAATRPVPNVSVPDTIEAAPYLVD